VEVFTKRFKNAGDLWDRFTEFKEKLFDKTSTLNHPWVIFDVLDKRLSVEMVSVTYFNKYPMRVKTRNYSTKSFLRNHGLKT
jgi:polyphosphate kinase 2 (PPK2 family)